VPDTQPATPAADAEITGPVDREADVDSWLPTPADLAEQDRLDALESALGPEISTDPAGAIPPMAASDDEMCEATTEHDGRIFTCMAGKGHPAGTLHAAYGVLPEPVHTWPQQDTCCACHATDQPLAADLPFAPGEAVRLYCADAAACNRRVFRLQVGWYAPKADQTAEQDGTGTTGRDEITPATAAGRNYTCPDCGTTASYPAHDVTCWRYYVAKLWGSHQAERAREAVAAVKAARDAWLAVPATSDAGHDDAREQARHALTDARHEAADALRWLLEELDTQAGAL
jgi:hypothetical protein